MKTVLIAWELGSGLGHVMRASAFAEQFAQRGFRVVVCLRELADCAVARWPQDISLLQSPMASRLPGLTAPANYGEILFASGYHDGNQLSALIASWSHLIELVDPAVIITDHAPTAHLAARLCGVAVVRIGTGFFAPPPQSPTPRFRTWHAVDHERMAAAEARVLQTVNEMQKLFAEPLATSLSAALVPDLDLIAGWPELDCYAHYRPQGSVTYIGNERIVAQSAPPSPPANGHGKKRIAAYLKGGYGALEPVLRALGSGYSTIAYVTSLHQEMRGRWSSDSLWFSPEPLNMIALAQSCDLLVCHAGAGTAPLFLEAGKPVLLLPYQAEQRTNADKIVATGAGLSIDESLVEASFATQLGHLTAVPDFTDAAQVLAQRWSGSADAVATATAEIVRFLDTRGTD